MAVANKSVFAECHASAGIVDVDNVMKQGTPQSLSDSDQRPRSRGDPIDVRRLDRARRREEIRIGGIAILASEEDPAIHHACVDLRWESFIAWS